MYEGMLYSYALKYTRSKQDAEDITQDSFAILWRRWNRVSEMENIKGYLFLITRNLCHNYYRKQARNKLIFAGYTDELLWHYHPDWTIEKECDTLFNTAINKLTEKQQQVLLLRDCAFSRQEMADKLKVSKFTIDNHITTALKKVRGYVCRKLKIRDMRERFPDESKQQGIAA